MYAFDNHPLSIVSLKTKLRNSQTNIVIKCAIVWQILNSFDKHFSYLDSKKKPPRSNYLIKPLHVANALKEDFGLNLSFCYDNLFNIFSNLYVDDNR